MNCLNIISLALTVAIVQANDDQCEQVVKGSEIDFQKVFDAEPWYMTYRINDEAVTKQGASYDEECIKMTSGSRVDGNKIILDGTSYDKGSSTNHEVEIMHDKDGIYKISMKSSIKFINKNLALEGKDERVNGKDITIFGKKTLILTDYTNYLIFATCSSQGKWVIWFTTPTPTPTTDQLNAGCNRLVENGVCAKIFPTKCPKLDKQGMLN